ncbi:hypothetical protein V5O48_005421 [Marasmius crinis-equi]|uniref:Uncharacterized protein n=1 Tax=Marasmius crinis-equi TaxID=585013 RepID=A0ABR3FMG8_9AGAR
MSAQIRLEDIPSNIELLQDDMCLRFLASFKSKELDRKVLKVASISLEPYAPEEKYGTVNGRSVNHTSIIFGPTNTTVAVGAGIWRVPPPTVIGPHLPTDSGSGLGDRSVMANGESRFTFIERKRFSLEYNLLHLDTDASEDRLVWLSQASCVFHTRGIFSEDEKLRDYSFPKTPAEYCQTASYHYWSFEPTGQPSLSKEACHQLGLPFYFSLYVYSNKISHLENISYKRIHEYQVARGFDPKTSDFARFLGYPAYEVQHDSDRFEEVDRAVTIVPSTSPGSTRRTIAGSKSTKSTTPPSEQSTPGPSHSTTTAKPRFSVAARQTYQAPTNLRASSSQLANRNSGNDKTTENKGKMRAVSSTPRRKTSDTSSSMPDGKKGKKEITTREAASPVSRGLLKTSTLSSRSLNPPTSSTIGVPAATLRAKDPIPAARNPSQRRVGVPAPPGRTREEEKTTNRLKGASQSVRAPVAPRLPLRSKPATTVPSKLPKPPMMEGASASTSNTPPTKPCAASTSSGSVYDEPPKAPQAIGIGSSASTRKVEGEGGKEAQTPISSEADATTESFQSRAEALEKLNGYIARKNVLEDEIRRLREKLQRLKSMNGTLGPGSSTIA